MFSLPRRSFAEELQSLQQAGHLRERCPRDAAPAPWVSIDNRLLLSFASNDYLALGTSDRVVSAFYDAARQFGVGSGGSQFIVGYTNVHQQLEQRLARHFERDRALLYASGYAANLGALSTLVQRPDIAFHDRLNHASLIDASRMTRARFCRYSHVDATDLRARINAASSGGRRWIVTEGVFSMDGDVAPLTELRDVSHQTDARLIVDDAHGIGVLGPNGRGSTALSGLTQADAPLLLGTLGKSLGALGAFAVGEHDLVAMLEQRSRTAMYSTSLPPAVAAAALEGLNCLVDEPWRQERLAGVIRHARRAAAERNLAVSSTDSAILPFPVADEAQAVRLSFRLKQMGMLVPAIRPPTVPRGKSRLRISFSAAHEPEHVNRLMDALSELTGAGSASAAGQTY